VATKIPMRTKKAIVLIAEAQTARRPPRSLDRRLSIGTAAGADGG
jgi:hypothetical protein